MHKKKNKKKMVAVMMTDELKVMLEKIAYENGLPSRSSTIDFLAKYYLRKRNENSSN